MPPPSVRPAMPVVETAPPVVARPNACVSRSNSPHVRPGCARTVRVFGSTRIAFRAERSITRPPSHRAFPATLWPPPRIASSRPWARPEPSAALTSATPVQRAIAAGRLSIIALWSVRAAL